MHLADIAPGQRIRGIHPTRVVTLTGAKPMGQTALHVYYEDDAGELGSLLVIQALAESFELIDATSRPFDADPELFRLAAEAQRIREAAKYDPFLAVSTSDVRPLPHQLKAVYEEMLPRIPLRFLLADDPGAGKTIMAGLYAKQLILRDDVQRCLIVAPGGLVEQWQDELATKFGLSFTVLDNALINAAIGGSVFQQYPRLIVRMDHVARNEDLLAEVRGSQWDLVIVDEAHRMGAHYFGAEAKKTKRFQLGELLRDRARHLLLMTATPHAGKEEDFQLFLTLLDRDTFAGRARDGVTRFNPRAFMRRLVKEELLTMDGQHLFPERRATTVNYELSPQEQELYERVSQYVRTEMNRADKLDGKRKNTVGFALTVLQRRLASSPEAIHQSLSRRAARLRKRRDDILNGTVEDDLLLAQDDTDEEEEFPSGDFEELEERVVDSATSARTVVELEAEIASLDELTELARRLQNSGSDVKWTELSNVIQNEVIAGSAEREKLIIFTEHRDTLEYLRRRVATLVADPEAVLAIHGGVNRRERRRITAEFTHNPQVQFLIATDAAGEGLNLQVAHLMVNYDLPWNPNRLEQRFGRIHRIGQEEVCQLWNLVAVTTREGDVYTTLLAKLEEMRAAYGGKVFDVLGEAFSGRSLRDLLIEAVRYGKEPEVRARMLEVVNERAGAGLKELLDQHDLDNDHLSAADVDDLRRELDEAYARRLAPHFLEAAFASSFHKLGGKLIRREERRYEITHVPQLFRSGGLPISTRYERVTFDPQAVERVGAPRAELLAPGHALHDEVLRVALGTWGSALTRGTVFCSHEVTEPHLLVGIAHDVSDSAKDVIDRRFRHLLVASDGSVRDAGPAPHLDLEAHRHGVEALTVAEEWFSAAKEAAMRHVVDEVVPHQLAEIGPPRERQLDRLWDAVYHRLTQEMERLGAESLLAQEREARGEPVKESSVSLLRRSQELGQRLKNRRETINAQRLLVPTAPRMVSVALVLPPPGTPRRAVKETEQVERRAVDAVMAAERALGRHPVEQPHFNPGFDILSEVPGGLPIRIEVKGRIKGAEDFTITRNEVLEALNTEPRHRLALVAVDPDDPSRDELVYVTGAFKGINFGDYSTAKLVLPWKATWKLGGRPW